jgi:DNA polymerase-3 subunit gamma/tau
MSRGHDIKEFLAGLTEHFRNILIAKTTGSTALIESSDVFKKRYAEEAQAFSIADLLRLQRLLSGTETAIRWSAQPRFKLEADFVQMMTMPSAPEVGELIHRIDEMKKKLDDGLAPAFSPSGDLKSLQHGEHNATPSNYSLSSHSGKSPSFHLPHTATLISTKDGFEGELASRWTEFIAAVRAQRPSLGSVLESSTMLGANDGTIRIGCGNEFQASSIKRNKELLSGLVQSIFNVRANLDVELKDTYQQPPARSSGAPLQKDQPSGEQHPVVQALIRELGAEPL